MLEKLVASNKVIDCSFDILYKVHLYPSFQINQRSIPYLIIHYILSGSMSYEIDEQEYVLRRGDIIMIAPFTKHKVKLIDKKNTSLYSFRIIFNDYNFENNYQIIKADNTEVESCFQLLYEMYDNKVFHDNRVQYSVLLMSIFIRLNALNYNKDKKSELVKNTKNYIKENLEEKLLVEELAQKAYVSQSVLNRHFKNEEGITVKKYIIKEKMRYSRMLIEDTDRSISEIATILKYANVFAFSEQFKKYYSFSPSYLRTERKNV